MHDFEALSTPQLTSPRPLRGDSGKSIVLRVLSTVPEHSFSAIGEIDAQHRIRFPRLQLRWTGRD